MKKKKRKEILTLRREIDVSSSANVWTGTHIHRMGVTTLDAIRPKGSNDSRVIAGA